MLHILWMWFFCLAYIVTCTSTRPLPLEEAYGAPPEYIVATVGMVKGTRNGRATANSAWLQLEEQGQWSMHWPLTTPTHRSRRLYTEYIISWVSKRCFCAVHPCSDQRHRKGATRSKYFGMSPSQSRSSCAFCATSCLTIPYSGSADIDTARSALKVRTSCPLAPRQHVPRAPQTT